MPSSTPFESAKRLLSPQPGPPAQRRVGWWLFAGHLLTVWGIALSNALMALMAIWCLLRRRLLGTPEFTTPATLAHRPSWPRMAPLLIPVGLYSVFFLVSALTSVDRAVSLEQARDVLSFATVALAPLLVRGEQEVRHLLDLFLVMVVGLALHGIGQYYFTDYGTLHQRIIGLFSHYQTFAGVLLLGVLALAARLAVGGGWRQPLTWLALALTVWTLLLTLTRGAWVAALVIVVVVGLVIARWRVVVAVFGALVIFFAFLAPDSWTERLTSIQDLRDVSNYDRLCMTEAAGYMISERPLFGIGPEVVKERYPIYRHPTAPRVTVPHLHSTFLQRAAEQGLVGLAAYLWIMLAAFVLAFRGFRREGRSGPRADLYLTVILVIVGFNVAGLFEDNWRDTEVRRLLLYFLAIPLCLEAFEPSEPDPSELEIKDPSP